nr:hypothetical protein [uncultured Roseateles sp.]
MAPRRPVGDGGVASSDGRGQCGQRDQRGGPTMWNGGARDVRAEGVDLRAP